MNDIVPQQTAYVAQWANVYTIPHYYHTNIMFTNLHSLVCVQFALQA